MENESNKMTAVQWLWEQIDEILPFSVDTETGIKLYNAKEQAKAMEKEQMIKFAMHLHDVDMTKTGTDILMQEAEKYYEQTYGDNK